MNRKLKGKIVEMFGTQADFAQAIKTDETIVSRVVRGRRTLNPEAQKKWGRALSCDLKEVLGE